MHPAMRFATQSWSLSSLGANVFESGMNCRPYSIPDRTRVFQTIIRQRILRWRLMRSGHMRAVRFSAFSSMRCKCSEGSLPSAKWNPRYLNVLTHSTATPCISRGESSGPGPEWKETWSFSHSWPISNGSPKTAWHRCELDGRHRSSLGLQHHRQMKAPFQGEGAASAR